MDDAPTERSVYCLMCRALTTFTSDDVKEREQHSECNCVVEGLDGPGWHAPKCASFNPPQIVDYIICAKCKEQIPLGLPRFRSQPGPPGSI